MRSKDVLFRARCKRSKIEKKGREEYALAPSVRDAQANPHYCRSAVASVSGAGTASTPFRRALRVLLVLISSSVLAFAGCSDDAPGPDTTPTGDVTDLNAIAGKEQVTLNWTEPSDSDYNGVIIAYQSGDDAPATCAAARVTRISIDADSASNHTITNLANDTKYSFRVCANDTAGNEAVGVTTSATPSVQDVADLNAIAGKERVTLNWTKPSDSDYNGVTIAYQSGNNAPAICTGAIGVTLVSVTGSSAVSRVITGLTIGMEYSFRICANDTAGDTAVGVTVSATPLAVENVADLTTVADKARVTLNWTKPSDSDYNGVTIAYQSGNNAPAVCTSAIGVTLVSVADSSVVSRVITSLVIGTKYSFRVCAEYVTDNTAVGVTASATPPPIENVAGLTTIASKRQITLNWTKPIDSDYNGVTIAYQSGNNAPAICASATGVTLVNVAGSSAVSRIITGLTIGTEYSFRVCAEYSTDDTATGVTASATSLAVENVTDLTAIAGKRQVTLNWTKPIDSDYSGVTIAYQSGDNAPAICASATDVTLVNVVGSSAVSRIITGLAISTKYSFRVCANDIAGDRATGVTASATSPAVENVADLTAVAGKRQVTLSWTKPRDSEYNGVTIAYQSGDNAPAICTSTTGVTLVNVNDGNAISRAVAGLTSETKYSFRVCANYTNGDRAVGVTTSATPSVEDVGGLTSVAGKKRITLSWTKPIDSEYNGVTVAYQSGDNAPATCATAGGVTLVDVDGSGAVSRIVAGLTVGARYSFRVCANYTTGDTAVGAIVSDTPLSVENVGDLTAVASKARVDLSWTKASDSTYNGVTIAYQSGANAPATCATAGGVTLVDVDGSSAVSHAVTSLINNTKYSFRVCANYTTGDTAVGVIVSATTPAIGDVSGLTAIVDKTKVDLSWTKPSDSDYDGVIIAYQSGDNAPSTCTATGGVMFVDVDGSSAVSGTVIGLTNNTKYSFRVCAKDVAGDTAVGVTANATLSIEDVTSPSAKSRARRVKLSWTKPSDSDYDGVTVAYQSGSNAPAACATADGTRVTLVETDSSSVIGSIDITGLTNNLQYGFRICAKYTSGDIAAGVTLVSRPSARSVTNLNHTGGQKQIGLSWNKPNDSAYDGVIVTYSSKHRPAGDCTTRDGVMLVEVDGNNAVSTTITGLTNGTGYRISVCAKYTTGDIAVGATASVTPNFLGTTRRIGSLAVFGGNKPNRFPGDLAMIGDSLYMVGGGNNALYNINTINGRAIRIGRANELGVGETAPTGLAAIGNTLYMVGKTNAALYTVNTNTGVATRVNAATTAFGAVGETAPTGLAVIGNTLYMVGTTNDALYTVNTTTGVATRVGNANAFSGNPSIPTETAPTGLAAIGNTLYMLGDQNNTVYTVNTSTGIADTVSVYGGTISFGVGEENPTGIAAVGNYLFMVGGDNNTLYGLDTTTGRATRIGSAIRFGFGTTIEISADYAPFDIAAIGNTLYMVGTTNDTLYTVNTTTGEATRVGSATAFGVGETLPTGLTAIGNTLYMVGNTNGALYTVDTTTGEATRVGSATAFGVGETVPTGLAARSGGLFMVGTTNNAIYNIDRITGVATYESIRTPFLATVTGLTVVGTTTYMTTNATDALYSYSQHYLSPTPLAQVGSATAFGVGETFPAGLAAIGSTLYMVGRTNGALYEIE